MHSIRFRFHNVNLSIKAYSDDVTISYLELQLSAVMKPAVLFMVFHKYHVYRHTRLSQLNKAEDLCEQCMVVLCKISVLISSLSSGSTSNHQPS